MKELLGPQITQGLVTYLTWESVLDFSSLWLRLQGMPVELGRLARLEVNPKVRDPIVEFMPEQRDNVKLGGSMRLGSHKVTIRTSTMAEEIYNTNTIYGRHRHRYELNQRYLEILEKGGLVLSGFSDGGKRTEILEIPKHKFYFATQYHSEFSSRLGKPEKSFLAFIESASARA